MSFAVGLRVYQIIAPLRNRRAPNDVEGRIPNNEMLSFIRDSQALTLLFRIGRTYNVAGIFSHLVLTIPAWCTDMSITVRLALKAD